MTEHEILEYNKRCAEFMKPDYYDKMRKDYPFPFPVIEIVPAEKLMGYGSVPEGQIKHYRGQPDMMKYHSDWNWIMEVRNKILSINSYSNKSQRFTFNLNATAKFNKNENDKPYKVRIKGVLMSEPRPFIESNSFDEKEAVVQAINQFLIWYNENKTN